MANIPAIIQEREARLLNSWMHRDASDLRKLAARDCVFVFATDPVEVLDRASFIEAIGADFRCLGYRTGENVVRPYGKLAWYTATAELELKLGVHEWSGRFLITGLWRRFTFGGWKQVERSFAPLGADKKIAASIQRLQMWT